MKHWLFIRGLGRNYHHWGDFGKKFQAAIGEDKIIFLDTLGNGEKNRTKSPLSIHEYTDDLRQSLDRCFKDSHLSPGTPKLNLLAISMGAMIATDWAHRFPHEIESLCLINTSDAYSGKFYQRLRWQNYFHLLRLYLRLHDAQNFEFEILKITTNNFSNRSYWSERFAQLPTTTRINWLRQMIAASRYHFPLQKPGCEVKIISSQKDRLVSSECSLNIARRWGQALIQHPRAGHDLPLEDGDWLLRQILR